MGFSYNKNFAVTDAMEPWKNILDKQQKEIIGETKVDLERLPCFLRECKLGNFIADSAVYAFSNLKPTNNKSSIKANIAIINSGSIRTALQRGNLTYGQLIVMSPYENVLRAFNIPGPVLVEALEHSLSKINSPRERATNKRFLQVSGLKVIYDIGAPIGQRVQRVLIRCQNCSEPVYEKYDEKRVYRLITSNFIANGRGGFSMLPQHATEIQEGITDMAAIVKYLRATQPISPKIEHRISIINSRGNVSR